MYTPIIPLEEATMSEVLARVAFRLVQLDYKRTHWLDRAYEDGVFRVGTRLDQAGFKSLAVWIASASYHMRAFDMTLGDWRDAVIHRARRAQRNRRAGKPWRRVP